MNNIKLLKDYDPGSGRIRKAGQIMRVDPVTKKKLITEGVAESYKPGIEIQTKKAAKAAPKEVHKPAKAISQEQKK